MSDREDSRCFVTDAIYEIVHMYGGSPLSQGRSGLRVKKRPCIDLSPSLSRYISIYICSHALSVQIRGVRAVSGVAFVNEEEVVLETEIRKEEGTVVSCCISEITCVCV